jgi:nucleolar GTP-binding protein
MSECLSKTLGSARIYEPEAVRNAVLKIYMERVDLTGRVLRSDKITRARAIYIAKLDRLFSIIVDHIGRCARLPKSSSMHPFYAEIATIASNGRYDELIDRCRRAIHLVTLLYKEYRRKILSSEDPSEIKRYVREYVGRSLSITRRGLRGIEVMRRAIDEIRKSPCISGDTINIVISGMPQVGKSTLVSRISSAKPETSPFPFTTKRVIMGHLVFGDRRIAVIDTPGILDRSLEEMNKIELKAVSAIKHLADIAIFMLDPRRGAYYDLEQQLNVLKSVERIIDKSRIIVAINKIDISSKEEIDACIELLKRIGYERVHLISAIDGRGLDSLLKEALKVAEERIKHKAGSI